MSGSKTNTLPLTTLNDNIPPNTTTIKDKGQKIIIENKGSNNMSDKQIAQESYGSTSSSVPLQQNSPTPKSHDLSNINPYSNQNPPNNGTTPSVIDEPNSDHEFEDHKGQKFFQLFTILPLSANYKKHEFRTLIQKYFKKLDSTSQTSKPVEEYGRISFTVNFYNEKVYKNHIDKEISISNTTLSFHISTNEIYTNAIRELIVQQQQSSILLYDVPNHMEDDIIVDTLEKNFGKVHSSQTVEDIVKNDKFNVKDSNKPIRPKPFKKMAITFRSLKATTKIFNDDDIWSIQIQGYTIRILPIDRDSECFKFRTSCSYRLTGLPLNCTANDLAPILTSKLKAQTCTITPNFTHGTTRAYVYVKPEDFNEKIFTSWNIFNTKIYCVSNSKDTPKYCIACGNPTHLLALCKNATRLPNGKGLRYPSIYIQRENNIRRCNKNIIKPVNISSNMDTKDNNIDLSKTISFNKSCNLLFNNVSNFKLHHIPADYKYTNSPPKEDDTLTIRSGTSNKSNTSKKQNNKNKKTNKKQKKIPKNKDPVQNIPGKANSHDNAMTDDKERSILLKENAKLKQENEALSNRCNELAKNITVMQKEIVNLTDQINNLTKLKSTEQSQLKMYIDDKFKQFIDNDVPLMVKLNFTDQLTTEIRNIVIQEKANVFNTTNSSLFNEGSSTNYKRKQLRHSKYQNNSHFDPISYKLTSPEPTSNNTSTNFIVPDTQFVSPLERNNTETNTNAISDKAISVSGNDNSITSSLYSVGKQFTRSFTTAIGATEEDFHQLS